MPHLISTSETEEKVKSNFKWSFPRVEGKFGFSLMFGRSEVFIGVAVARIEVETIVRKKKLSPMAPPKPGKVKTLFFPS